MKTDLLLLLMHFFRIPWFRNHQVQIQKFNKQQNPYQTHNIRFPNTTVIIFNKSCDVFCMSKFGHVTYICIRIIVIYNSVV